MFARNQYFLLALFAMSALFGAQQLRAAPLDPAAFTSLSATFAPAAAVSINTTTLAMTGGATFTGVSSGGVCVFCFGNVNVGAITFTVTGTAPLAILAQGTFTWGGTLNADAVTTTGGPGGFNGATVAGSGSGPGPGQGNGAGAGGGAFGGNGGTSQGGTPGGTAYGNLLTTLQGGSGGGRGSFGGGIVGGGGGGAVEFGSIGVMTINATAVINCRGANAGAPVSGADSGGGGAGGGILLHAISGTINAAAALNANAGNGGAAGGGGAFSGGGGGGGRILLINLTGTGTTNVGFGTGPNNGVAGVVTSVNSPSVTAVAPNNGPIAGGTALTITGTNFVAGATVSIGGTAATAVVVVSATSITCNSPAHAAGLVDVIVTTGAGGPSVNTAADNYTYNPPAPTVTGLAPTSGTTFGGTSVTITGTNFVAGATVAFSGSAATGVTVVSATSITCTSPAHAAGVTDVLVTTGAGTSANTAADNYTYVIPVPAVTGLAPTTGFTTGGTSVTITGTGFIAGATVTFGGVAATGVTVVSATSITCTSPANPAGVADVLVTTAGGTSANTAADNFTYTVPPAPTLTLVTPASGPLAGGQSVTLTGTNLLGATSVTFAGTAATAVVIVSSTSITCTTPAGTAGTASVIVTTPGGSNAANTLYTYAAGPAVGGVAPVSGPIAGGTTVIITGTDFTGATSVLFGATAAASFTVNSGTQITATSPAHALGLVDITVTTPSGTSAVTAADNFTFVAPEMDVTNGASAVADGAISDPLGNVPFGIAQTVTYTITNSGTAALNLTGTPDLVVVTAGTNVTSATVTTVPASSTVAAAGTVTFTVTYTVTAAGAFAFTVSIANDDANENPYDWTADGTGVLAPEMDVTRSGAIADGGTDAQAGAVAGTNIVLTYTIANNGNSVLTMTLPVTISGLVNCTATVTTAPATATVAAAANETFVITLKPTAAGSFSASVSITNDDANENPYNWTISGTATAAPKKKKKDEGGCSTGDTNNALLMIAGVMATLGLALRLRRKTA